MAWWKENIFCGFLLAFLAGIFLSDALQTAWWPWWSIPIGFTLVAVLWPVRAVRNRIRLKRVAVVLAHIALVGAGAYAVHFRYQCHHRKHYCSHADADYYVAVVDKPPEDKNKVTRVEARLVKAQTSNSSVEIFGNVYLYLQKSERSRALRYGDVLLIENTMQPVEPDPNPHAIDYSAILRNKQIYQTGFVSDAQWSLMPYREANDLFELSYRLRLFLIKTLQRYIPDDTNAAVAASLLLGYRDAMDFDLENAYAAAGVVHLLAVSGMHVGLIFVLFNAMLMMRWFSFVPQTLRKVLLVLLVWGFAMLTGFSGSVVRASAMITAYIIGMGNNRYTSPLNMLFASTFVLLAWQPRLAFDVGFELSFSAVLGIMLFQRPVHALIGMQNPLLDALMRLISVSIAAQISTLPLILYYFHQFPVHFLWANLVAVPLATALIYGLIGLLAISFWPAAAGLIGLLLDHGIGLMNGFVRFIGALPFAVYHIFHFDLWMAAAAAAVIGLMFGYIETKRTRYLNASLFVFGALLAWSAFRTWQDGRKAELVVFRHAAQPVVSIRNGYEALLLRPRDADFRTGAFDRYLGQFFQREGVRHVKQVFYEDSTRLQQPFDWVHVQRNIFRLEGQTLAVNRHGMVWTNMRSNQSLPVYFYGTPITLSLHKPPR